MFAITWAGASRIHFEADKKLHKASGSALNPSHNATSDEGQKRRFDRRSSVVSGSMLATGRFVAAVADFRARRGVGFRGFFDIAGVPDPAAISGLAMGRKPLK